MHTRCNTYIVAHNYMHKTKTCTRSHEEKLGAEAAGTLMGGRPSRYVYEPIRPGPETEQEKAQLAEHGWDGCDVTPAGVLLVS
jgi:hypothetical protein